MEIETFLDNAMRFIGFVAVTAISGMFIAMIVSGVFGLGEMAGIIIGSVAGGITGYKIIYL